MMKDTYVRAGKVINIVDGDTVDIALDLGFNRISITQRFRIRRINSPEKFGLTKEQGLISKQFAIDNLLNKEVIVQSFKDNSSSFEKDSFGRFLAEIYYKDATDTLVNYSDEILLKGLAILFMDK